MASADFKLQVDGGAFLPVGTSLAYSNKMPIGVGTYLVRAELDSNIGVNSVEWTFAGGDEVIALSYPTITVDPADKSASFSVSAANPSALLLQCRINSGVSETTGQPDPNYTRRLTVKVEATGGFDLYAENETSESDPVTGITELLNQGPRAGFSAVPSGDEFVKTHAADSTAEYLEDKLFFNAPISGVTSTMGGVGRITMSFSPLGSSNNSLIYYNAFGVVTGLTAGSNGQVLTFTALGPSWETPVALPTPTAGRMMYGDGANWVLTASSGSNGEVMTMGASNIPNWAPAAGGGSDQVKITTNDTTAGYLDSSIIAGVNLTKTTNNPAADETMTLDFSMTGGATNHAIPRVVGGVLEGMSPGAFGQVIGSDGFNIGYGYVADANVDAFAAIAGTKISPNFGSQNIVTSGTFTCVGTAFDTTSADIGTNVGNTDITMGNTATDAIEIGTASTAVQSVEIGSATTADGRFARSQQFTGTMTLDGAIGTTYTTIVSSLPPGFLIERVMLMLTEAITGAGTVALYVGDANDGNEYITTADWTSATTLRTTRGVHSDSIGANMILEQGYAQVVGVSGTDIIITREITVDTITAGTIRWTVTGTYLDGFS